MQISTPVPKGRYVPRSWTIPGSEHFWSVVCPTSPWGKQRIHQISTKVKCTAKSMSETAMLIGCSHYAVISTYWGLSSHQCSLIPQYSSILVTCLKSSGVPTPPPSGNLSMYVQHWRETSVSWYSNVRLRASARVILACSTTQFGSSNEWKLVCLATTI